MAENMQPSVPEESSHSGPKGWVWIAGIILVVAAGLYLTGRQAPHDTSEELPPAPTERTATAKDVPLTITMGTVPKSINAKSLFGLDWQVDAPEQTSLTETAVYWDTVSHPGDLDTTMSPEQVGYKNKNHSTGFLDGNYVVPNHFEDNIKSADAGTVMYIRAVAVMLGKYYWSQEYPISVIEKGSVTGGGS